VLQNKKESSFSKTAKSFKDVGPYLGLGTQLAATVVLMFYIGYLLDDYLESKPVFTIIFSFVGGAAGVYNFIKTVLNLNKKDKFEKN
jgi:F0F1-type ATP synthase assembly protein I